MSHKHEYSLFFYLIVPLYVHVYLIEVFNHIVPYIKTAYEKAAVDYR